MDYYLIAGRAFSAVVFVGCCIYVFIRGYDCISCFLDKPQAVNSRYAFAGNETFPSFTFCPLYQNQMKPFVIPKPYKTEVFFRCNLSFTTYNSIGPWSAQAGGENCTDPKLLQNAISPRIEDLGLAVAVITTFDSKKIYIPQGNISSFFHWTRIPSRERGQCWTMNLPLNIIQRGIFQIQFSTLDNTSYELYIHGPGAFLTDLPNGSPSMILESPVHIENLPVNHEVIRLLDYDGDQCIQDDRYELDQCRDNHIIKVKITCDMSASIFEKLF